ncbi:MAG TPA: hypothetical protein VJ810_23725 [Blastocatellia bacterium]|nr:hypothetical protein [Blastocatellia bacterium]
MIRKVSLSTSAAKTIAAAALQGYNASYKQERLGILLGRVSGSTVKVEQAVVYRGGIRTRTAAQVDSRKIEARVKALQAKTGLRYLGGFHTHNQIGDTISSALSQADKTPLCDNLPAVVELIACIWTSDGRLRASEFYLQGRLGDCRIRMAGYACQQKFQRLVISARAASISMA